MDDPTSFDTLLERIIEEARADPAARDKLLRALLPMELLRLPEEVADIKRLLEQTIQTQERLAETQKSLIETQAGILKTQEKLVETVNRLDSRQEEIAAEQARLRTTQEGLVAAVDRLTKTQEMIIAELAEMRKTQERFAAEQSDMRKTLDAVVANQAEMQQAQEGFAAEQSDMRKTLDAAVANQAEMQQTQKRMLDDIGHLKGESLEVRLDFRLVPKLRQHLKIRKTKVMRSVARPSNGNFFEEIDDAEEEGIITERQRNRIYNADMIMKGLNPKTEGDLWIAIEASRTINASDIDRAKETAEILSVVYEAAAEAVVAGYEISEATEGYAQQNGVKIIQISRVL